MSDRADEHPDAAPRADPFDPDAAPAAPQTRRAAAPSSRVVPVEPPSTDVGAAPATALPGMHRGGFQRWPTEPVGVTIESAPVEPGGDDPRTAEWLMTQPPAPRRYGGWALGFGIVGLAVSLLVGWGFLLGLVGVVLAIIALRRPAERRAVAVWALSLSLLSLAYSAGWLVWAATRGGLFG